MIHIYCGDGKGKTTASIGLIIRALGSGMKVIFLQMLKNSPTSEIKILENLEGLTVLRGKAGKPFTFKMTEGEKELTREIHNENLETAINMIKSENIGMLVIDECIASYNLNLLDRELLLDFIYNKPRNLELVLTGREPSEELVDRADYVSEIKKIKHPFDKGIGARIGIEK